MSSSIRLLGTKARVKDVSKPTESFATELLSQGMKRIEISTPLQSSQQLIVGFVHIVRIRTEEFLKNQLCVEVWWIGRSHSIDFIVIDSPKEIRESAGEFHKADVCHRAQARPGPLLLGQSSFDRISCHQYQVWR